MSEPLFRSDPSVLPQLDQSAGVLTPGTVRKALDELWNPARSALAPWPDDGIEQIPALHWSPSAQAKISREHWDREAWIEGIKKRLGLVCIGDGDRRRFTIPFELMPPSGTDENGAYHGPWNLLPRASHRPWTCSLHGPQEDRTCPRCKAEADVHSASCGPSMSCSWWRKALGWP